MRQVEEALSSPARPEGLWRNRSFVLLFTAQVVSLLGSGATTIGLVCGCITFDANLHDVTEALFERFLG